MHKHLSGEGKRPPFFALCGVAANAASARLGIGCFVYFAERGGETPLKTTPLTGVFAVFFGEICDFVEK